MLTSNATSKPAAAPGADAFTVEDIEYLHQDGKPLLLRLFRPNGAGPFPLLIDVHGGAWCGQDRTSDALFNEALANSGVVVAALDFRMPPTAGYPASLADINYAIRWLKARAGELKSRADRVGLLGVSSGAHQAMLSAMRPRDTRYAAIPLRRHAELDATVAAVVLVWPVIDPLRRFHHAKRLQAAGGKYPEQIDRVIPLHIKFWTVVRLSRCRRYFMCKAATMSCTHGSISNASWQAIASAAGRLSLPSTRVRARVLFAIRPPRPPRLPCNGLLISSTLDSTDRQGPRARHPLCDGGRRALPPLAFSCLAFCGSPDRQNVHTAGQESG
jgi:alpha/beta hydrolase fold